MRILLVTGLVAGGVGRHVEQLTAGLRERGHRVVVAAPADVAGRFDLGPGTVDLPVGDRPHPLRDARTVRTLARVAAGADVVHAHGLRAGALAALARGTAGPATRRSRRTPLVVTTHNAPPDAPTARAVYLVMEQVVARSADLVLGVSPDLVERARRAGAPHTGPAVVPASPPAGRPVDREQVRRQVRGELGLGDPGPALVVTAGRLAPQKGLETLVEAHRRIEGERPGSAVLAVAGEGPERSALEAQVAAAGLTGRVLLLGHRRDVPDLLAAADLVVSSARWEGQPVWLQEALQQGAPIVATDVGGTGVLLGECGLLVDPDAPDLPGRLAATMAPVLRDPALAQDLRSRAGARARQLPDARDAVEAVLAAYAEPLRRACAPTSPRGHVD